MGLPKGSIMAGDTCDWDGWLFTAGYNAMLSQTSAGARASSQGRFEGDVRDVNPAFTRMGESLAHPWAGGGLGLSSTSILPRRVAYPIAWAGMSSVMTHSRPVANALWALLPHEANFSLTMVIDMRRISA